jgi:cbb3-type cytochrome oxidase subunit 3
VSVVHSETYEYVTNTIIFIALIVLLIFILKIILAFGNYMNGTRKKVAAGFKLESLYKVG